MKHLKNQHPETRPQYIFNQERFELNVSKKHKKVDGTGLCLEISKIKIYTRVTDECIAVLEKAHQIDSNVVYKLHDAYVIKGYCLGTIAKTEMHTVIMKDKDGNWIRGTRGDEPYHAYKVYRKLIDNPVSKNAL